MIKTILIDDEVRAIRTLEELLSGHADIKILDRITDPSKACEIIEELHPDLLFLDVQMPGKDGFEIVKELNALAMHPSIIFVTAFNEYAISAIRHAAFDFLLKPVDPVELNAALDRFRKIMKDEGREKNQYSLLAGIHPHGRIKFATGSGFILVRPEDIIYILADWNYSDIYFSGEKHEMVTSNLGAVEKMISPMLFHRVSRSLIINLAYLTRVNRKKRKLILTKDGKEYTFDVPLLNIRKMERMLEMKR